MVTFRRQEITMNENESIEIPLGTKDSELKGWEYTIPEGMEAEVKDGKIIVREKESEDERIRKELIKYLKEGVEGYIPAGDRSDYQRWLAWVEKQSEQKWSEEDESKVKEIVYFLDTAKVHYASTTALDDCVEWLKSLKQRMEE